VSLAPQLLRELDLNSLHARQRGMTVKVQQENHHHGHDVGERLYLHRHSFVHSLPPHLKIIAAVAFILIVVSTPVIQWPAFVAYFIWLLTVVSIAKIPFSLLFKRSLIEIPFVFFAILMPFFGSGEKVQVGPFELYREGLIAGSGIVVKGTLGVMTAIILSTSTTAREILRGLERLKLPVLMVQIASFMLRYVNVVNDEMERMKVARESRGFEATGLKHWKVLATVAGALFIRSYERGERVHLSMLSRGYEGVLPHEEPPHINRKIWLLAMAYPLVAAIVFIAQLLIGKL
jgi:cobalt/nickel transport system permease protein